ncbi:MAG: DUF3530 family protein [Pseudomonadota bacterium]|nr:DUF3530 family protein [Pseudomonadota bacterium]
MKTVVRLLLLLLMLLPLAHASDLAKEQRWADQIADSLIDGEAVWLQAGDVRFLGIYTEAETPTGRAALVIHGIGVHPDWTQVVYPLRTGLPARGWSTLSLQMPVLPNEADSLEYAPLFEDVAPRIDAGIAYLEEQGAEKIAIVGHSLGAAMSSYYLSGRPDGITAYVGIGMLGGAKDPRMDNLQTLRKINIPVLDIYGQNDLVPVTSTAAERVKSAEKAGNEAYSQVQTPQADHFYEGHEEALVETVTGWLDKTLPAASR